MTAYKFWYGGDTFSADCSCIYIYGYLVFQLVFPLKQTFSYTVVMKPYSIDMVSTLSK